MSVRSRVDVTLKPAAIAFLTRSPQGMVGRAVKRGGDTAAGRAKEFVNAYGRVATGQMRDTIHATPVTATGQTVSVTIVAPVRYARYQHDGTRHIQPAPFLQDAVDSLTARDFT